ncbi:MAG: hypothetical protein DCF20_03145 [Pseudanabaena sp.]|nr:MAG: hypothetical protein DCF20_03145 [Pseudanabaena sp.]
MKFTSPSRTIQNAIALAIKSEFEILLDPREIGLDICYPKYNSHYVSAIALGIYHRVGIEANQIAERVSEAITETCLSNSQIFAEWAIKPSNQGLLNIHLKDLYLSKSIHTLMSWRLDEAFFEESSDQFQFWQKRDISINPSQHSPEPMQQYAYARCCALIRLIDRTDGENSLHIKTIREIESMKTEEVSLLLRNLAIADYLENENLLLSNSPKRQKLSRSLAEAFLQFYDRCRIFGVSHEIAIRRLLLIRVTQKCLAAISPPDINYAMYL